MNGLLKGRSDAPPHKGDCLVWDEHLDIVTGRPAGTVGGVSRSLRLHYYAEKHIDGAPNLLVEAHQHVPAMFEDVVVSTVTEMVEIVGPVRELLRLQQQKNRRKERSQKMERNLRKKCRSRLSPIFH